jgi:hypothetical protein
LHRENLPAAHVGLDASLVLIDPVKLSLRPVGAI